MDMKGPTWVQFEQDESERMVWSEFLEEDRADWWTLEWIPTEWFDGIGHEGVWTSFFNGPRGWKHAVLDLRNWEAAYLGRESDTVS